MQWEDILKSKHQTFTFTDRVPDKSLIDKIVQEIHAKCPSKQNRVLYDLKILDWSDEELRLDLYKSTERDPNGRRAGEYNPQTLAPYLFVWSAREIKPMTNSYGEDSNPEYKDPQWQFSVTNMEIGICSMFTVLSAQAKGLSSGFCKCIQTPSIEEKYGFTPLLFLGIGYSYDLPKKMFYCPVNKKNMEVPYGSEVKPEVDSYISYSV
jgi:hypothetical protein